MQEVTISVDRFKSLIKADLDLSLISLENKHLKMQLATSDDHINDLYDVVRHYKDLWHDAENRVSNADRRLEEYANARANLKL